MLTTTTRSLIVMMNLLKMITRCCCNVEAEKGAYGRLRKDRARKRPEV